MDAVEDAASQAARNAAGDAAGDAGDAASDAAHLLRTVADGVTALAARTTAGDWRGGGLLASRPEVVAHSADGATQHVAEARAATAAWIVALSPAVAPPLADWLRSAAEAPAPPPAAVALARVLLDRLPAAPAGA